MLRAYGLVGWVLVLGSGPLWGQTVWDMTGPIDPNYAVPNEEYQKDHHEELAYPEEEYHEAEAVSALLQRLVVNHYATEGRWGKGCHRRILPGLLRRYRRLGFALTGVKVWYLEQNQKSWQGDYQRKMQVVELGFTSADQGSAKDRAVCATPLWHW